MNFANGSMLSVRRPEMLLFDYGGTLAREAAPDFLKGWQAVFQHIEENPDGATPQQARDLADQLWRHFSGSRSLSAVRKGGVEVHEWHQLLAVLDGLGLKTSLSLGEIERILMDNACPCQPVPHAAELLALLDKLKIPTGVISNIGWSGQALAHRLAGLFPAHHFAFVLASSEYGICKPDPLLFRIALKKAGLPGEKVWFCGDDWEADIEGARGAGIFPVWYQTEPKGSPPDFPCLPVSHWRALGALLESTG